VVKPIRREIGRRRRVRTRVQQRDGPGAGGRPGTMVTTKSAMLPARMEGMTKMMMIEDAAFGTTLTPASCSPRIDTVLVKYKLIVIAKTGR